MSQAGEARKYPTTFDEAVRLNELLWTTKECDNDCGASPAELGYAAWYANRMVSECRKDIEKLRNGPQVSPIGRPIEPETWLPKLIELESRWAKKAAMLEGLVAAHTPPPPQT